MIASLTEAQLLSLPWEVTEVSATGIRNPHYWYNFGATGKFHLVANCYGIPLLIVVHWGAKSNLVTRDPMDNYRLIVDWFWVKVSGFQIVSHTGTPEALSCVPVVIDRILTEKVDWEPRVREFIASRKA